MKNEILLDDFAKILIRIGKIISVERIPSSKTLLKIIVDIGDKKRQIVSGLAKDYAVKDLIGQQVTLITNLRAVKLRGVTSHGMILTVKDENDKIKLLQAGANIKTGQVIQ